MPGLNFDKNTLRVRAPKVTSLCPFFVCCIPPGATENTSTIHQIVTVHVRVSHGQRTEQKLKEKKKKTPT